MTLPLLSRFLLVGDHRPGSEPPVVPVRRCRLARAPAEPPCDRERFAYLKKTYD